jgi:hypothetical protein
MNTFTRVRFIGPIVYGSEEYPAIVKFRGEQNRLRAPYLEQPEQLEIEKRLRLDERSLHFALERNGAIIACVRITPAPFEFSELSSQFAGRSAEFSGYYEFGRLCTDIALERKGFYAGMLVVKAARHIFMSDCAEGIVAVCRSERIAYMQKLGLDADPMSAFIPARASEYRLVHASKERLIRFYFDLFYSVFSRSRVSTGAPAEASHESRTA